MAFDPRTVASGIQTGRSLAPQGPPIQEMLGMKMQQNQAVAEIMKELLKAHMTDISDLRKTQLNLYYKALADPNLEPEERDKIAEKIQSMDLTNFGVFNSALKGGFGKMNVGDAGGAKDILKGTPISGMDVETAPKKPAPGLMQNIGQGVMEGASNFNPLNKIPPAVDTLMQGLKAKQGAAQPGAAGKDKFGFTLGQTYKGYKYIGNNQWQKF